MSFLVRNASKPGFMGFRKDANPGAGVGVGGNTPYFWGMSSLAGEVISPQVALQLSAVWSACKILGETIGMLPLDMYERNGDTVAPNPKHPLQFYLHDEPNPEMGAIDWRMAMTLSLALWGNAYAKIVRLRGGRIAGLWMLQPQLVNIRRNSITKKMEYVYYPLSGGAETYTPDQILHVRTLSLDGINGLSPIIYLRNAVGLAMALEKYGSRFFANGAVPGVILQYPNALGDEAIRNIKDSWEKMHMGSDLAHGVAVLEEGMTAQVVAVDPQKAQSLESRKFQILEVARIYRNPPHMLMDLDRSSFSNIESQGIEFVTYTLLPWLKMWESAISRSLIDAEDKGRIFAAFNVMELMRGDLASRYAAYAIGRQWGWLSVNDICRMENRNGIGEAGNVYLEPLNMIEVGSDEPRPQNPGAPPVPPKAPKPPAFVAPPRKMLTLEQYLAGHKIAA
jgi:HK97 family phage portal protein